MKNILSKTILTIELISPPNRLQAQSILQIIVLSINPQDAEAYFYRGLAKSDLGEYNKISRS
jgi:hypothetical protein